MPRDCRVRAPQGTALNTSTHIQAHSCLQIQARSTQAHTLRQSRGCDVIEGRVRRGAHSGVRRKYDIHAHLHMYKHTSTSTLTRTRAQAHLHAHKHTRTIILTRIKAQAHAHKHTRTQAHTRLIKRFFLFYTNLLHTRSATLAAYMHSTSSVITALDCDEEHIYCGGRQSVDVVSFT